MTKQLLTAVYYTSNFLDEENPEFLAHTKKQLVKALGDIPLLVISHRPVPRFHGYMGEYQNVVLGEIGRSHLNLYKQIMIGCREAKTKYVAMAEDDIFYSYDHFHTPEIDKQFDGDRQIYLYDMNKVSLFTWTKPPLFSFRSKRRVVNQLIAPRKMLQEDMEERFRRVDELLKMGRPLASILHVFGDPGRYETQLGITQHESVEYYCSSPSVVFTHPSAYGYLNHGKKKRLGDIRIVELADWGKASDMMKLWGNHPVQ